MLGPLVAVSSYRHPNEIYQSRVKSVINGTLEGPAMEDCRPVIIENHSDLSNATMPMTLADLSGQRGCLKPFKLRYTSENIACVIY